jgi:hypothetical protein
MMWRQILYLTGIDRKLQELKQSVEERALTTIDYIKAVAVRTSIGTGLSIIALVLFVWAVLGGLIALFFALQPEVGNAVATGIISVGLLIVAAGVAFAAMTTFRRDVNIKDRAMPTRASATVDKVAERDHPPGGNLGEPSYGFDSPRWNPPHEPPQREAISRAEAASLFGLTRPFSSPLKTGVDPVDNILAAAAPKAEEAAVDVVVRAATLVRCGDRKTLATVLGAAVAIGWLISKGTVRPRGSTSP